MVTFGANISQEDNDPVSLLKQIKHAEKSGFEVAWSSDHFHPYYHKSPLGADANAGVAFSWLGAAGAQTKKIGLGTMVTAPL